MIFRVISLIALLGTLGTSSYFRYQARAAGPQIPRSAEGAGFAAGRAMVALPLFAGLILYVVRPAWISWAAFGLPAPFRWLGAAVALATIPAAQWVFRSLGRNVSETVLTKERQELVTTGPYRWVRHPLYATGLALFLGIGLMAANAFILAFTLLAAVLIRWVVIPIEERELIRKFGDPYRAYMARTGRLVPRLP